MSRVRPSDRLKVILDAASDIFSRKGLQRTKMSDVATAAGVSQGTLYSYVESKEALFRLLLDRGLDPNCPLPETLPIPSPPSDALAEKMTETVEACFALPSLEQALCCEHVADFSAELCEILNELYARLHQTRRVADILERSALEVPELTQMFFGVRRQHMLARFEQLVRLRCASGAYYAHDPPVCARVILQSVEFFARDSGAPLSPTGEDDSVTQSTVIAMLAKSIVACPAHPGELPVLSSRPASALCEASPDHEPVVAPLAELGQPTKKNHRAPGPSASKTV
jgi:AcrR family transcriptional regulator